MVELQSSKLTTRVRFPSSPRIEKSGTGIEWAPAEQSPTRNRAVFWRLSRGSVIPYALIGLVHELSHESVAMKVASLYAALERLQGSGLVEPDGEEVVDGRLRRYFALKLSVDRASGRRSLS